MTSSTLCRKAPLFLLFWVALMAAHVSAETLTSLWSYTIPTGGSRGTAVDGAGNVYTTGETGTTSYLYSISPAGVLNWSVTLGSFNNAKGPSIDLERGVLYVAMGNGYNTTGSLRAFALDGTLLWDHNLGGVGLSNPAIARDGTIYTGAYGTSTLHAVNPDGTTKWIYALPPNIDVVTSGVSITEDGKIAVGTMNIVAPSTSAAVYLLNPDGTFIWTRALDGDGVTGIAVTAEGHLVVTEWVISGSAKVYGIDINNNLLWSFAAGDDTYGPALAVDGTIYASSFDGKLYARYPDGSPKWEYDTGLMLAAPVAGENGTVYVASRSESNDQLFAISATGQLLAQTPLTTGYGGAWEVGSPSLTADGKLYVSLRSNQLQAFSVSSQGFANSAWPKTFRDNQNTSTQIAALAQLFNDVALAAQVNDAGDSHGLAWGDFDGDGDQDLYSTNNPGANRLYRNDGGVFVDIAGNPGTGVNDPGNSTGLSWADMDNDGDLDLYVSNNGQLNKLYRNDGGEQFADISASAQIAAGGQSFDGVWADYDLDGDLDLYVVQSSSVNLLYRNDGINTAFSEVSGASGVALGGFGRGASWADFDNDNDLDLYLTNASGANKLFENQGGGSFVDISSASLTNDAGIGVGASWADFDNDGDLDLHVSNQGSVDRLLRNDGLQFADISSASGMDDSGAGTSSAWADYDGDGDLDLYLAKFSGQANRLFQNPGNSNNWLEVRLEGTMSNRDGIGAKVRATTGTLVQRRDLGIGSSILAQNSLPVEFGLGSATVVDQLTVEWPSGVMQTLSNVSVNQVLTLIEPAPPVVVSFPDTASLYDAAIHIPVRIGNTDGQGIVSAEIFVAYDGDLLTPSASPVSSTAMTSVWAIETNVIEGNGTPIDTLKVAMADEVALIGAGDLLVLHFDVADVRVPASSQLALTHVLFNDGTPGTSTLDGSLTVVGTTASTGATPSIIPRESFAFNVNDADENTDPATVQQITVSVVNGAQIETLTLFEQGTNTDLFSATISTVFSLASTSSGVSGDGIVQAKRGDVITFFFDDQLTATGAGPVQIYQETIVTGGFDGSLRTTVVVQPGDTSRVKVVDADLSGSVMVQIENLRSGETGSALLQAFSPGSSVFYGRFFTDMGTGVSGDSTLSILDCDTLLVTYDDTLTALGGTATLTDHTYGVVPFGDANDDGISTAFDAALTLKHVILPFPPLGLCG